MKLIAEIISTENWKVNFNHLENGAEVMDYLHKKSKYKDCATPSLILDLNLPEKRGLELLKEIKTDSILKCIPVIILTNSNNKDALESYIHPANAYITKPIMINLKSIYTLLKNFGLIMYNYPNGNYPTKFLKPSRYTDKIIIAG